MLCSMEFLKNPLILYKKIFKALTNKIIFKHPRHVQKFCLQGNILEGSNTHKKILAGINKFDIVREINLFPKYFV